MKKITISILTITILFAAACTKEKAVTDNSTPRITISSPTEGQVFMQMTSTDSATLSGNITDEDLHKFSVLITNTSGNDTLLNIPGTHQEINDINISQKFKLPVVVGTVAFKVIINAEDHSGNVRELVRIFSIEHM